MSAARLLLFPLLAFLLLYEALAGGAVLLPAEQLYGFSPWNAAQPAAEPRGQWNALQWDAMAEFLPWRLHLARAYAGGLIPLWNPHVLCGTPFLANSQSAPLYPPHFLLALGPAEPAAVAVRLGWLAFLHLTLAGLFACAWARALGARPAAALVGGAAYQLSGFLVAWLELPSFPAVACWIPLAALCAGRAGRERSAGWTAATGAAVGMMLLAGHLQIALYGLLAALLSWLHGAGAGLRATRGSRAAFLLRSAGRGLAALLLGLALAAPQLLPALELGRISHRAGPVSEEAYQGYLRLALPPQNWVTLLVPDYYGLPARGDFWGYWSYGPPNVMEYAGHAGAAAFMLAGVGLCLGGRAALLPAALGTLALLLAAGSPLCRLLYFGVPGFAQTGSPARALVLFCLAQAMLAALGVERLLHRGEAKWTGALLPAALSFGAAAALASLLHLLALRSIPFAAGEEVARTTLPALVRALAYGAALPVLLALVAWLLRANTPGQRSTALGGTALLVVGGGLVLFNGPLNPIAPRSAVYPETPLTRALAGLPGRVATLNRRWSLVEHPRALLPPNASMVYGGRDAQGYDSLLLRHFRLLANSLAGPAGDAAPPENGNMVFLRSAAAPLFPLLGARHVISSEPLDLPGLVRVAPGGPGEPYLYRNESALPEAYTTRSWEVRPGLPAAAPPEGQAVVAPVPGAPVPGTGPPGVRPAALDRPRPGRMEVEESPAEDGRRLLVVGETAAPGWKAVLRLPGEPPRSLRVLRVHEAFQGVVLEGGPARVDWRYEPASFRVGLFLALAAAACLAALALARPALIRGTAPGRCG